VLTYDGDEAGQRAAQRAIPMLEKAGIQVKVLQMKDAKDPDEFLHKFGADRFKLLLEDSSNRVEYQLNAIARKYDLTVDDEKVKFLQESADLIATLGSAVQREVYGGRVAEIGKISSDAMKIEVDKAYKRRLYRDKKKQEQIDLAPAKSLQPKSREIRYDNLKSALAEEEVIAMVLREPAMLDQTQGLSAQEFSSSLLGKVYDQLQQRHRQGLGISTAVLTDLTPDEMSHVALIVQRQQSPVNEQAFSDCIRTIRAEHQSAQVKDEQDLQALANRLRERKGIR
jgi:DNA primase